MKLRIPVSLLLVAGLLVALLPAAPPLPAEAHANTLTITGTNSDGDPSTTTTTAAAVTLTRTVTNNADGGPDVRRFANDGSPFDGCGELGGETWTAWETFSTTKAWTLLTTGEDEFRRVCLETAHGTVV